MRKILLITSLLLLLVIGTASSQTPIQGNSSPDCHAARIWHLQAAMRYSESQDQEYHLGAADAAYMLAEYGEGYCRDWKKDAMGARYNINTGEMQIGESAVEASK